MVLYKEFHLKKYEKKSNFSWNPAILSKIIHWHCSTFDFEIALGGIKLLLISVGNHDAKRSGFQLIEICFRSFNITRSLLNCPLSCLDFASWFPTHISCSPNLPSVYIRVCKHGNHFKFLHFMTVDLPTIACALKECP